MKKLLIPALAIAALGSANLAFGASFINASNAANTSGPWTYGVQFEVPAGGYFVISDIQVFDVQAGNTLRVGLWANGAANGYGIALYSTTVSSTGAGAAIGSNGYVSLNSGSIFLPAGGYTLGASGFNVANSLADSTVIPAAGTATVQHPGDFVAGSITDFVAINTDPTFFNPVNIGLNLPEGNPRWKSVNFSYTPVPEPETYAMVAGAALVGFGLWRRRQAK